MVKLNYCSDTVFKMTPSLIPFYLNSLMFYKNDLNLKSQEIILTNEVYTLFLA